MPKHILINLSKIKYKQKILKAAREKQQITYKGIPIRLTADFSAETLQARRKWQDIFKVMKGKNLQLRLLYPARISFRFAGEIKTSTDKQKLREFRTTSFTANAKGSALGRKHKRRKRPTKKTMQNKQNNYENGSGNIHIDNYLKCIWTKCCNQKT